MRKMLKFKKKNKKLRDFNYKINCNNKKFMHYNVVQKINKIN